MSGSDFPEGPDWTKHDDGRWYPPGSNPSDPPAKGTSSDMSGAQGCLYAVVGVVALGIILAILGVGSGDAGPDEWGARDVCEQSVREQLRSPSSASFGGHETTQDGSEFEVTGHVDAENAFGASIRTRWICTATHVEGDRWSVSATLLE